MIWHLLSPIKSAFHHILCSAFVSWLVMLTVFSNVEMSYSLRLTHMKAPLVADFREEMQLECGFDMEDEDLYAVKWYKDDQEFFRYMPGRSVHTMSFPVAGVHIVQERVNCSVVYCTIRLKNLTKEHSGGAYRCEISSEAPAFRLASETHNVTVAALPRQNPRIEGLTTSYIEGDTVEAKCVSDPADPTPILSWYINGIEAPSKLVGEMLSSEIDHLGLASRSLSLRFLAERKYTRGDSIELRCMSSLPGVPLPPQETIIKIPMRTPEVHVVNNQKLHWFNSHSKATNFKVTWILLLGSVVRWTVNIFQDSVR